LFKDWHNYLHVRTIAMQEIMFTGVLHHE